MQKAITIVLLLFLLGKISFGQTNILERRIDSLKYLTEHPFPCNSVYWRVVAAGKEAIPLLLRKIVDTAKTKLSLACKETDVRFGDVCYEALSQIFYFRLFYITHQQFDLIDQLGCQSGEFTYLNDDRQKFQAQIESFYKKYKAQLKFVKYDATYKNDCKRLNKIWGYYEVDPSIFKNSKF